MLMPLRGNRRRLFTHIQNSIFTEGYHYAEIS